MTKRTGLVLTLLILSAMLLLCGCGKDADNKRNPAAGGGGKEQAGALDINALTAQWAESPHSNILLAPAQRDGCVVCHDGGAFAENQTEVAAIERDFFVSIDCRACHTGQGAELMAAGRVDIPTAENVAGGTGAYVCSAQPRKAPSLMMSSGRHLTTAVRPTWLAAAAGCVWKGLTTRIPTPMLSLKTAVLTAI